MFRFVLVIASLVISCLGIDPMLPHSRLSGRILEGENANIEDIPYQLAMEYFGRFTCGASIISNEWAVTAAHCLVNFNPSEIIPICYMQLRAGSDIMRRGGTVHQVSQVIAHSQFTWETMDCDIAVIKVSQPFVYGEGVKPISLATTEPSAGEMATVSGWGLTSPGDLPSRLQFAQEPVVDNRKCNDTYFYQLTEITANMICAGYDKGGKEACFGDSGGPLVIGEKLVGIVSWGGICGGFLGYPIVYSNVASLREFVISVTGVN